MFLLVQRDWSSSLGGKWILENNPFWWISPRWFETFHWLWWTFVTIKNVKCSFFYGWSSLLALIVMTVQGRWWNDFTETLLKSNMYVHTVATRRQYNPTLKVLSSSLWKFHHRVNAVFYIIMRLCQHADRYISMVWFSSTRNAFEVLIIHTLGTYRLIDSFPAVCLH